MRDFIGVCAFVIVLPFVLPLLVTVVLIRFMWRILDILTFTPPEKRMRI